MEVETEVTTDDSDEDVMQVDGTIAKKKTKKRRASRGKTGAGQGEDGEPRRRRKVTRRRKLTQKEIQKGKL